jgi:NAD(P)-dependent dehydrogenase (short-subunit alcohol dehydrogenase family)
MSTTTEKLGGKIALVTGGSSGIGLATAQRFVAEGAQVFITGRSQNDLDRAFKEIGESASGVQGDISNLADLDRLYDTIKQKAGRLDILVRQRRPRRICAVGTDHRGPLR